MSLERNQELEQLLDLQKKLNEENLPDRIIRLSHVSWYPCWIQQLKTEGKSSNTIKSYLCAAKKFLSTKTSLNENNFVNLESITVKELNSYINPNNGRLDIWLQSINELKPSTVNARLAAISHLIEWVGHHLPEHIIRPRKGKQIPSPSRNHSHIYLLTSSYLPLTIYITTSIQ